MRLAAKKDVVLLCLAVVLCFAVEKNVEL